MKKERRFFEKNQVDDEDKGPMEGVYAIPDARLVEGDKKGGEDGEEEDKFGKEDDGEQGGEAPAGSGDGSIVIFRSPKGGDYEPRFGAEIGGRRREKGLDLKIDLGILRFPNLPIPGGRFFSMAGGEMRFDFTTQMMEEDQTFKFGPIGSGGEILPPPGIGIKDGGEGGQRTGMVLEKGWGMVIGGSSILPPGTMVKSLSMGYSKRVGEVHAGGEAGILVFSIEGREGRGRGRDGGSWAALLGFGGRIDLIRATSSEEVSFSGGEEKQGEQEEQGSRKAMFSGVDVFGNELWGIEGCLARRTEVLVQAQDRYRGVFAAAKLCVAGAIYGERNDPMGLIAAGLRVAIQEREQNVSILAYGLRSLERISGPTFRLESIES